jgi:hypothetical protein
VTPLSICSNLKVITASANAHTPPPTRSRCPSTRTRRTVRAMQPANHIIITSTTTVTTTAVTSSHTATSVHTSQHDSSEVASSLAADRLSSQPRASTAARLSSQSVDVLPTFNRPLITFHEHDPPSNKPFDTNNNSLLLGVVEPTRSQLVSSDVSLLIPTLEGSDAARSGHSPSAGMLVENRRLSDSAALASSVHKPKLASFMPTKRCVLRLDGCSYLIGKSVLLGRALIRPRSFPSVSRLFAASCPLPPLYLFGEPGLRRDRIVCCS